MAHWTLWFGVSDVAQWLINAFYATGMAQPDRFMAGLGDLIGALGTNGAFSGDNLLAFGRNLSFATDPQFIQAFLAAKPDNVESSLAWRCHVLYWAARRGLELDGDFVEAACYRGFSARVIVNATNFAELNRRYWLYDRFPASSNLPAHEVGLFEKVVERFSDCQNVRVIKGDVPAVLATEAPDRISFLHLDMNNAAAEIGALAVLYDRVSPGALIVLDDYGWADYAEQKAAHDSWFRERGKMVVELPTGQGLVIK